MRLAARIRSWTASCGFKSAKHVHIRSASCARSPMQIHSLPNTSLVMFFASIETTASLLLGEKKTFQKIPRA
jgi:hypothetical protein